MKKDKSIKVTVDDVILFAYIPKESSDNFSLFANNSWSLSNNCVQLGSRFYVSAIEIK